MTTSSVALPSQLFFLDSSYRAECRLVRRTRSWRQWLWPFRAGYRHRQWWWTGQHCSAEGLRPEKLLHRAIHIAGHTSVDQSHMTCFVAWPTSNCHRLLWNTRFIVPCSGCLNFGKVIGSDALTLASHLPRTTAQQLQQQLCSSMHGFSRNLVSW